MPCDVWSTVVLIINCGCSPPAVLQQMSEPGSELAPSGQPGAKDGGTAPSSAALAYDAASLEARFLAILSGFDGTVRALPRLPVKVHGAST